MANRSRLSIMKPQMEAFFCKRKNRLYNIRMLQDIYTKESLTWRLPISLGFGKWIEFLILGESMSGCVLAQKHRHIRVKLNVYR